MPFLKLSSVDGEKLPTRDGFQFLESVEKTTMQLMGECEVPSKNVPKVIQAVSNWMFDKKLTSSYFIFSMPRCTCLLFLLTPEEDVSRF